MAKISIKNNIKQEERQKTRKIVWLLAGGAALWVVLIFAMRPPVPAMVVIHGLMIFLIAYLAHHWYKAYYR